MDLDIFLYGKEECSFIQLSYSFTFSIALTIIIIRRCEIEDDGGLVEGI